MKNVPFFNVTDLFRHFQLFSCFHFCFQKIAPQVSLILRQLSDASTDLKAVLAAKIPKEQERVKNFRKNYGNTKVGEVTVDMVSKISDLKLSVSFSLFVENVNWFFHFGF